MNKTIINKLIILIMIKNSYTYKLDLNDIFELKTLFLQY